MCKDLLQTLPDTPLRDGISIGTVKAMIDSLREANAFLAIVKTR